MTETIGLPWDRFALITKIAEELEGTTWFGKTKLQKLVYLLTSIFEVDVGYDFRFHHYGVYSWELLSELDMVKALGGVNVDFNSSFGGYQITPGEKSNRLTDKSSDYLREINDAVHELVREFGRKSAADLELLSTIVYAAREQGDERDDAELVGKVEALKPRFSRRVIERDTDWLRQHAYL